MKPFFLRPRHRINLGIMMVVTALQASAAEPSMWEASAKSPVPVGAKVTLELDRHDYFLGENVLVHFILENTSDQPFSAGFGGDYRGASRNSRFKVTATDESGHLAEDPYPSEPSFGGFGGDRTLKPGERYIKSLPLMRYREILQPGVYTIRVTHDFGWKEGDRKRPVGEVTLRFRMPNPMEAERLITAMEKLPSGSNNLYGERAHDYSDFACLRLPVYLKPLLQRAERGDRNALEGICWIETQDATAALIALATNSDSKLALEAVKTLSMRLPDPALESTNGFGGFAPFTKEVRRRLVTRSWNPGFTPDVRSLATNFLARPGADEIAEGGFLVASIGTPADAPAVNQVMDRVLGQMEMVTPRQDPKDDILDQPLPLRELINAMNVLHEKGYTLHEHALSGDAQILMYFIWLEKQPPPGSEEWHRSFEAWGTSAQFPIRVAALNSIPQPVPADCLGFVRRGLSDSDLGVCRDACTIAGRSGDKDFLKPVLEIVATEHHEWLLREASETAKKLGAGFDLLSIWADRLTEEKLYELALDNLQDVIEGLPKSYTGRTDLTRRERIELRKAWTTFLANHADEIRGGKKFKLEDAALTPALFGRARTWQLPGGKFWPISWSEMDQPPQN